MNPLNFDIGMIKVKSFCGENKKKEKTNFVANVFLSCTINLDILKMFFSESTGWRYIKFSRFCMIRNIVGLHI